jgi:hypothetical protein
MSLLNPAPDRDRVEKIVDALDTDSDGEITIAEVKILFSKLLKVPEEALARPTPESRCRAPICLTRPPRNTNLALRMPAPFFVL